MKYIYIVQHMFNMCGEIGYVRITDEGSVPEMRIWSNLFIKSN